MAELTYNDRISMIDDVVTCSTMRKLKPVKGVEPSTGVKGAARRDGIWRIMMWHPGDAVLVMESPLRRRKLLDALEADRVLIGGELTIDDRTRMYVWELTTTGPEPWRGGDEEE